MTMSKFRKFANALQVRLPNIRITIERVRQLPPHDTYYLEFKYHDPNRVIAPVHLHGRGVTIIQLPMSKEVAEGLKEVVDGFIHIGNPTNS
jgi:hypothetical protein